MGLSVTIITKNEAGNIRDCLDSVVWADEIIVVDSGSDDETLVISKEYTNKVFVHQDWQGFGVQKNRALQYASHEWVLSLDADERVSPELKNEIKNIIDHSTDSAFSIPRQAFFLGQAMRHGGWWPDYVVRLFRRGNGVFSDDIVHEKVLVDKPVKKLSNPLIHYSYVSLEQLMAKMNQYSSVGADKALQQGKTGSLFKALGKGFWAFFRAYFFRLGLLDGQLGFIAALSKAEETYYRYLKLSFLKK